MPFTTVAVTVGALNINDGENYILTTEINPSTVTYRRVQVTSPFIEGRFTTNRIRDAVEAELTVDVLGTSVANLQANITAIVNAFTQDSFELTITLDGTSFAWACEAADYAMVWDHARMHSLRAPMRFAFQRHPEPVSGPV